MQMPPDKEYYQNKLIPIILYWNRDISRQVVDFYNANAELGRILEKRSEIEKYNPLKIIDENHKKFLMANAMMDETLERISNKLVDKSDLYAIFYSLISAVQVKEYGLYEPFKDALEKHNINCKFDVNNIFSVTRKRKNKKGEYQTDARMIRNALAHIDYDLQIRRDSFTISIFSGNKDDSQDMVLTDVEFSKYIQNHKFLLQSIFYILMLMATFSTLRHYYLKNQK